MVAACRDLVIDVVGYAEYVTGASETSQGLWRTTPNGSEGGLPGFPTPRTIQYSCGICLTGITFYGRFVQAIPLGSTEALSNLEKPTHKMSVEPRSIPFVPVICCFLRQEFLFFLVKSVLAFEQFSGFGSDSLAFGDEFVSKDHDQV